MNLTIVLCCAVLCRPLFCLLRWWRNLLCIVISALGVVQVLVMLQLQIQSSVSTDDVHPADLDKVVDTSLPLSTITAFFWSLLSLFIVSAVTVCGSYFHVINRVLRQLGQSSCGQSIGRALGRMAGSCRRCR